MVNVDVRIFLCLACLPLLKYNLLRAVADASVDAPSSEPLELPGLGERPIARAIIAVTEFLFLWRLGLAGIVLLDETVMLVCVPEGDVYYYYILNSTFHSETLTI